MAASEASHDAFYPEREAAGAAACAPRAGRKRRQSPGVSLNREPRDHLEGNGLSACGHAQAGWLAKDVA